VLPLATSLYNDVLPDPPRGGWQHGSVCVCICVCVCTCTCTYLHQCILNVKCNVLLLMSIFVELNQLGLYPRVFPFTLSIRHTYNYWHTHRMERIFFQFTLSIRHTYSYWHTHRMERIFNSLYPSVIHTTTNRMERIFNSLYPSVIRTTIGIHIGWRGFSIYSIHPLYVQLLAYT